MANLPDSTTTTVLDLQRRLLKIINEATALGFTIFDRYGETETTLIALDDLQNVSERANTYYTRFYTLLLRIAESQPFATNAMLDLLARSIEDAQATADGSEATIREEKRNFNLP